MSHEKRVAKAREAVDAQRRWIEEHGGGLLGYLERGYSVKVFKADIGRFNDLVREYEFVYTKGRIEKYG